MKAHLITWQPNFQSQAPTITASVSVRWAADKENVVQPGFKISLVLDKWYNYDNQTFGILV